MVRGRWGRYEVLWWLGVAGTACCTVWDKDAKERRLLTSGHLLMYETDDDDDYCTNGEYHSDVVQPSGTRSSVIGEVVEDKCVTCNGFDAGLCTLNTDWTPHFVDLDDEYTTESITGIRSWDWMTSEGAFEEIFRRGRTTGVDSGPSISEKFNDERKSFYTDAESEGGDSGGPHYDIEDGDYWLWGVHNWTNKNNQAGALALEKIQEQFNCIV